MLGSIVARYASLRSWSTSSVNRRIFSATVLIAALGMAGKLAGLARDQVVAAGEGVGWRLDAYYAAVVVPMYIIGTLTMSLSPCLVPAFLRLRVTVGLEPAKRLAGSCLFLAMLLAFAVIAAVVLGSPLLLRPLLDHAGPDEIATATWLLYELVVIIAFGSVSNVLTALLQAVNRFTAPALTPGVIALASLIAYLIGGQRFGVHSLAGGIVIGYGLELIILVVAARRVGLLIPPRWHGWTDELRHVARQYWPVVGGMALMGSNAMIDQAMASPLGVGSVSALNYGNKLTALLTALGATSLGVTILPHLAQMTHAGKWSAVRHTLRTFIRYTLLVTVPVCAVGIALSPMIVQLLFERGQFSPADTLLVSQVQRWSLLQVPIYVVGVVGARMLSALEQNHLLLRIGMLNVVSNFLLDWLLRRWLGVAGIAAASAGVYLISAIVIYAMVELRLSQREQAKPEARAA